MRALLPLLALAGIIALPATLAQTPVDKPAVVDAPTKPRVVESRETAIVRLKIADVRGMAKSLSEVFSMEPPTPCGPFKVIADAETNTLVMTGSADALAKARTIIKELDHAEVKQRQTETIRLKNARAKDMADLLRQIASQQLPTESQPGITVDDRTATLVVTAEPAALATLKAMIATFDVADARPQSNDSGHTQARVTVFEVDVPLQRTIEVSSAALAGKASNDSGFLEHLAKLGTTKHLYTLDQGIDLDSGQEIRLGASVPIPTSSATKGGTSTTTVQYQDIGCGVEFARHKARDGSGQGDLRINVEISTHSDSSVNISPESKAPLLHRIRQSFGGGYLEGQPIILVSLESSPAKETATAYITRIELTKSAARG